MSDDTKAVETAEPKVDTRVQQDTSTADAEKKELIAQRDKLKAKLREIDEAKKKAEEDKAIEEGRLKEVLQSKEAELKELRTKMEAVETARQESRQRALDKVTDPDMKKFAEKMSDASEILDFVETVNRMKGDKLTTHTGKERMTAPEVPKSKSFREWEQRMNNPGGGLVPNLNP